MNYSTMTDEELSAELKKADLAERFLESEMGKLIKETCNRIVERVNYEQASCPMEEFIKLENQINWRMILKFYKYDLLGSVARLRDDGFLVYQELKNRQPQSSNEVSLNSTEKGEQDG